MPLALQWLSIPSLLLHHFELSQTENQILQKQGDQISVLPIQGVSQFKLLSDGRLVYSKNDADGLYLYDPKAAETKPVIADFPRTSLNLWTAVNQAIYFDRSLLQYPV